jgi:DivIVA domain-containing protein
VKKREIDDDEVEMFSGTQTTAPWKLSPQDIQNKEFRVSRMGGYRMRDVDEFLDEVTESMAALIAENERLRADQIAASGGSGPVVGDGDRTAAPAFPGDATSVRAFLIQERDFLRSLGTLVQGHAEKVKGMAKGARPAAAATVEATRATDEREEPDDDRAGPAEDHGPDPEATAAMSREELGRDDAEPVRVEEPQTASSRRADDGGKDRSLRELFWGEEG